VRMRLRTGVLTLLVMAPVATGCGELGGDTRPEQETPTITAGQIDRYEEGSPERAFLEWFRDVHEKDARAAARLYAPSLGIGAADVARQRKAGAYALDPLALPLIRKVTVDGDTARVRARFRTGRVWPNGRVDYVPKELVTFRLKRQNGRWLLADNGFLALVAREPEQPPDEAKVPEISRRQIERYAPGTPARAFLEWFRATWREDARTAARYYPPRLGLTPRELAAARRRAEIFGRFGPPRIVSERVNGTLAVVTVRTRLLAGEESGRPVFDVAAPTPFAMVKVDGRWRIPSNGFIEVLARSPVQP